MTCKCIVYYILATSRCGTLLMFTWKLGCAQWNSSCISHRCLNVMICIHRYCLLVECWNVNPQARPKFTEIVQRIDMMMEDKFGYMRMDSSLSLQTNASNKEWYSTHPTQLYWTWNCVTCCTYLCVQWCITHNTYMNECAFTLTTVHTFTLLTWNCVWLECLL